MATLYRKYRPQSFKELVGQNHIRITLEHEIESDRIAHAYLFCGPRAVGKTTIARLMSKAVNCTEGEKSKDKQVPCNQCQTCEEITSGRSLDIIEIDAASHTGVDNVRDNIIANARIAPAKNKYKVFIIDEVHMLSTSAFNALLKILEEPPEFVIFILCTTEVHKVPATIISRCQRFDFKRISIVDITKKLEYITTKEGIKVDKSILEAIARQSGGHMRDAESLLGQVVSIGGKEITPEEADLVIPRSDFGEAIKLIGFLKTKDAVSAITLINRLIDEGINLKLFLSDTVELMRKLMLAKINPVLSEKLGLVLSESLESQITKASDGIEVEQLLNYIDKFILAINEMKTSFITQLPIEIAITEICVAKGVQVPSVVARTVPTPAPIPAPVSTPVQTPAPISAPAKPQSNIATSKPAPAPPSPTETVSSNNVTQNAVIKKEDIISRWNEVLAKVKKHNHSLSFILRVCEPRDMNGNQLCLAFKYKFHKDRISEAEIKSIVEKVLHEVYGTQILIEAVIDESLDVSAGTKEKSAPLQIDDSPQPPVPSPEPVPTPTPDQSSEKKEDNQTGDDDTVNNLLKSFGGGRIVN